MLFVAFRAVLPSPSPSASTTPISVSDVFTRLSFFLLFHLFVWCLVLTSIYFKSEVSKLSLSLEKPVSLVGITNYLSIDTQFMFKTNKNFGGLILKKKLLWEINLTWLTLVMSDSQKTLPNNPTQKISHNRHQFFICHCTTADWVDATWRSVPIDTRVKNKPSTLYLPCTVTKINDLTKQSSQSRCK